MGDRLIRDLRVPKMNASSTMAEAADEIERLRTLITAWADADDAVSRDDYVNTLRAREQARDALRQAVGR
jgi:hypothetical protein